MIICRFIFRKLMYLEGLISIVCDHERDALSYVAMIQKRPRSYSACAVDHVIKT